MLRAMNMRTYGHNDPDVLHPPAPGLNPGVPGNTGIAGGLGLDNLPPSPDLDPVIDPGATPPKDSALELLLKVIRDA